MAAAVAQLQFLLLMLVASAHALYFEDGFDHHYTYSSQSDVLGLHNITSVIKFRIRQVNETSPGYTLHELMVDSFVQHSEQGYVVDNAQKWNLKQKFYFVVAPEGLVTLVHFHPEEKDEVLTLKKVLASTLSANVKVQDDTSWTFSSKETDHAGLLEHHYEGERYSEGVKLVRSHQSSTDVHRCHNKTLHLNLKGTPLHVVAHDNITLHSPPSKVKRNVFEGEQEINDEASGVALKDFRTRRFKFPQIGSVSNTQVKLTVKSKHYDTTTHSVHGLKQDTIIVKKKAEKKVPFTQIEHEIEKYLSCIRKISNKYDANRTECVHNLRNLIYSLTTEDLLGLGQQTLTRECHPNDTFCTDEKDLFIDIIAREGSPESQQMLLNYVMKHPNATEEDLRRCLFHCIALNEPIPDLISHVENLCFVENASSGETPELTKTSKRACLTLGSIAKNIHGINRTQSDGIVERIENWLDHHNQTKSSKITMARKRRSISQQDRPARKHVETKMVLIHSLGNAGKQRSIHHIKSYMQPNMGVTAWRRAAVRSLRHFSCNESAAALLHSAVHDDDDVVRKTAVKVLGKHPQKHRFTLDQQYEVLSKNYSYQVVTRMRRGLMSTLEEGIRVHLQPPGIEWDKVLGSEQIGASFGLHIRNILDLKLGILDGHFEIDVYDGAYAEAHVGLINLKVDIIKAYICFKGHIRYDLNVLKDFGINSLSDLVHIYDKIVAKIVDPIKDAVTNFRKIILFFKGHSFTYVVNTIVQTVKNLPTIVGEVSERLADFVTEIYNIAGSTVMEEIKLIVNHVRQFVDGVKQDILKFYNDIVDAVTMAMPYIAKKIVEAFNLLVTAFMEIINNPMASITAMSRAVSDVKMAVTMIVDVKTKIIDACMFIKGRAVEWLNTAKEIPQVLKRLAEAFKKLTASIRHRRALVDGMEQTYNNGVSEMKNSLHDLESDLKAKWDKVLEPLRPLIEIVQPFVDEFKSIVDVVQGLKWGYKKIKEVIQISKSLVQKVFGPKFDKNFPTERRYAKGACKEGVWPSTANGYYATTGVDIAFGAGQSIVNPVNGIVNVYGSKKKVVIQPTDPEFEVFEIVIENIAANNGVDKKMIPGGKKIGRATKSPKCKPNFIHLSLRQKRNQTLDDADYEYTDPSMFLDRLVPVPKWIQDCNDHEFSYIGQTFDTGESAEDDEPETLKEKVERASEEAADNIDDMLGDEDPTYRPDDPGLYDQSSFSDSMKKSLLEQAKKFGDFFKTALFGGDGPKVPNILELVDVNGKDVNWVLNQLAKGSNLYTKFSGVIGKLTSSMTASPKGNPATLALPYLKNYLKLHGMSSRAADVSHMSDTLMAMPEKLCPMFKGGIAVGFGHICSVHDDCLGIECSVPLPIGAKTSHIEIVVAVIPSKLKLEMVVQGKKFELTPDGHEVEYGLDVKIPGMKLYVVVHSELKDINIVLSAEAKLCVKLFATCLPSVELFHEIKFFTIPSGHVRKRRAIQDQLLDNLKGTSVPDLISHLGEFQLLKKDIIKVLEDVRETAVQRLMSEAQDKLGPITKEVQDKVDFCISANIPVPPFDIVFFKMQTLFMVGPVPLSLGFGAGGAVGLGVKVGLCVVSMTTQLTLTPWVGGKVWGDAAIDLFVARGGIRLIGYLMETKFPILVELVFSKYPIDVGSRMDMILRPLRLQLKAFAELRLIFTTVTVFDANIWQYSVPEIRKNIFNKKKSDEDASPPAIMPATINERRKRSGTRGCIVKQIPGRMYYDTAFSIEMYAQDERSETKFSYAIGTHMGGRNVIEWTDMGGSPLLVPAKLPSAVPLYWTVKAKNTQGLEAITQCSLNTFDSTLPDGRVEHAYKFSSHPSKLLATVIAVEDSPLVETHYKAVGYSPGKFGSQFVDWQTLSLDHSVSRSGETSALKHFTVPREGKLVAWVLKSQKTESAITCGQKCLDYGSNCVSFDYEYHSETCDFHDVVQGANAYLRISGTYKNYERLGSGYHTPVEYLNLELMHGSTYFVNAKVRNVLGYDAYLLGEGTLVDFTPPEPGIIKNALKDILQADKCTAAITQQCIDVTWNENHRVIIDGLGSGTVFNGHEPLFDELYTLTNHYVSANWKGFRDEESGIYGYTWTVGTTMCGTDVISYEDPYAHLTDKKFWTDSAFHKGVRLNDGAYYVTVQALNGAGLGGSLVTTVCHSTPFIVDTTPPVFDKVTDIIYDEDFDLIAIYYDAHDDLSKIAKAEFGLGKTKYDVQLKPYSLHASMDRDDPFVAVEDLGLKEGVPAWIRIRVTNNVDLFTSGHGEEPILIDKSPPIPGTVLDGDRLRQDRTYQSDDKKICAQWVDFYDPESGIDRYIWGVGTRHGIDDIVKYRNLTHYDKSSCSHANLYHNHTYFSTVFAYNNALNSKAANSSSDGVLVDLTPPIAGSVDDGKRGEQDMKYSSETVSKFSNWRGFDDPESGIDKYEVDVYVNNEHKKSFEVGRQTGFEDHTISMEHRDQVYFDIHGINGAELEVTAKSDGFLVDLTPPLVTDISDNDQDSAYQSDNSMMKLRWDFKDEESGIKEYRTIIYETQYGVKQKFWPSTKPFNVTIPVSAYTGRTAVTLDNLILRDGVLYSLHVTAMNGALLSTSHETTGVTIDTTPPDPPKVHIGLMKDEEELDKNNNVLHDDQNGIRVSWAARDSASGIKQYLVAVGTETSPESIYNFNDFGTDTTAYIRNIHFQTFSEINIVYIVSVKAINGAGLESQVGRSNKIRVQKANTPGVVFDGRDLYNDAMYTIDRTSVAASFYGFESESCNIIGYEWAIGMSEYATDVLSYTDYGIVMNNETHGQCQIHTELYEDTTYYITVRAITGCRDAYILSTSDGITVDSTPPEVIYEEEANNDTIVAANNGVIYQSVIDSLAILSNVTDRNSVATKQWALGSLPLLDDRHAYTEDISSLTSVLSLIPGQATFITTNTSDQAGNVNTTSSLAIIADTTAPMIDNLRCTNFISLRQSLVRCEWDTLVEYESLIKETAISFGTEDNASSVLDNYILQRGIRYFTRDLHTTLKTMANVTNINVQLIISNIVDQQKYYGRDIVVDRTEPDYDTLAVVTSTGSSPNDVHQKCQQPMTYVELRLVGAEDEESGLNHEKYEVSLGYKPYGTEVLNYRPVKKGTDGTFFINGFTLNIGTIFYATVRVFNKAGLYSDVTSDSVVVSQSPYLSVIDGGGAKDIDFQSMPNLIQGHWDYSDLCPIREAYWSIKDLTGAIIFDFQPIPSAAKQYFNDEVALENGKKYITIVKTVDFLNRTKIARSDGVTVRIQPPFPGHVRDGFDEDLNYQYSTTELSANWDKFGDNSKDPTQSIDHYEISIGNDRRYAKTRSNVHFFVNVGLNTTYTFRSLNLTTKLVRYYITVRSYSMAGGYAEGYSNGIRVGYNDDIVPGYITVDEFQSSTESIPVSWNGFRSDINIILYKVGISSHESLLTNDTIVCTEYDKNKTMFDANPLHSIGLNEYINIEKLKLKNNQNYFVTVIAEDEAGMCTAVTSSPILVDTTPPVKGTLLLNDLESNTVSFAKIDSEINIKWKNFTDAESDIKETKVSLFECKYCGKDIHLTSDCLVIAENIVENDAQATFYELSMSSDRTYFIQVEVKNRAELITRSKSSTILLDTSSPLTGQVKITNDWHTLLSFQHSLYTIHGELAIAGTWQDYVCPSQKHLFPNPNYKWDILSDEFNNDFKVINTTGAYLGIGYNSDLSGMTKSGIISQSLDFNKGNYSFILTAAKGNNIITTYSFLTDPIVVPYTIIDKPIESVFDESLFDNMTGLIAPDNATDIDNITISSTTKLPFKVEISNDTRNSTKDSVLATEDYGFGIHFLGYRIENNKNWHHVFWAKNKYTSIERWFQLAFDPTVGEHKYTVQVDKKKSYIDTNIGLTLIVDGEEIVNIAGFRFQGDLKLAFLTWNEDGYEPPIVDIYRPFYSDAVLNEIRIPDERDKQCLHGKGFYDGESGIKDIWLGVSDNKNDIGNISPMQVYKKFCFPCIKPCDTLCQEPCSDHVLKGGFEMISLDVTGLNLKPSEMDNSCMNETNEGACNGSAYYLNIKMTNFAGEETIAISNGIQVDITAPECDYVKCLDPEFNEDQPTSHIGSSSTIGAY